MGSEPSKTDKKVHLRDSSSREVRLTYKRRRDSSSREVMLTYKRRQRQQHEEPPPQAQASTQPETQQQQPPQAPERAKMMPQQQPQPQAPAQSERQPRLEPKHKAGDVPAQESKDTFWKSRDMGWKYGIMIDENRQHWKCMYCGLIRYGGGVSRLKRHLAGDLDVKMCPKVPANVAEEIRVHLRKKRERRRKRAAQNGGNNIKTKTSSDDAIVGKDLLPADLVVPPETDTNVLEEVTNQTSMAHEDPTGPKVPPLRTKDIGWEHAVDLDGNKRRWQCKFCSLCRSGGVTTLKAHLTDDSCPNVPKEISKKVSNFIQEKRAMRLLFSNFAFTVDDDQVSDSQIQEEGTIHCEDDQQPSTNATHKCATNEVANRSSQRSLESNGQPVEHCDQPEEQWAMDNDKINQMASNKHQISNKSIKNSKNTKTFEPRWKRGFSTRKHIVIVDASAGHWRCRYCGMDGYGKNFRLHYHLAGAFRQPKCPNVPKEVFAKARHYVRTKKSLKRVKSGKQIPSGPHTVGQSAEELQSIAPLCGNHNQLTVNDESNEHGPSSHLDVLKDATQKIRNQLISKDEQPRSESFDGNGDCSSKSSRFDQEHVTTTMHVRDSSQDFEHTNSKSGTCNTMSNPSQESVNPVVYHEKKREDADARDGPLMFHEQRREGSGASPSMVHEQQRDETASPSEPGPPGCLQEGQRMQWLLQHKPIMEEGSHANRFFSDTNKSEKQRSEYWTDCWRNVLNGLMHSSDVQEGAGIWTCIRDALLYGCAQLGTVPDTVELPVGTVNVNTAKCQNVLMDVLRSEDFVLLCNVLCRAVHQEGSRTRYFDFGVIDSRMKNGNYGHEPTLFMHDLKLVWEDLKMAGQNIIELANNLSSLTEASCGSLAEREKELSETDLKGPVVSTSGRTNFVESNALVISTSQCVNQLHQSDIVDPEQSGPVDLDQSDPVHVCDIQKDGTCNQCGKEARDKSVLTCTKCLLPCHISCTEPPVPSISTESWYCRNCRMDKSIEGDMVLAHYQPNGLHENCVACDRLEVCSSPKCEDTRNDNSTAIVLYNVGAEEDSELPEIDTVGSCKICGNPEEEDKRFLICGHSHCLYKYYHICCLQSKQIASDFQRDNPCWFCPSCLCRVCLSDKDDDLTILCDGCDEAYHLYCITPRRTSIPKGQWYCSSCSAKRAKDGIRRYERRMLKLHRKIDTRLQRKKFDGIDLLLSAADTLRADEQFMSCST